METREGVTSLAALQELYSQHRWQFKAMRYSATTPDHADLSTYRTYHIYQTSTNHPAQTSYSTPARTHATLAGQAPPPFYHAEAEAKPWWRLDVARPEKLALSSITGTAITGCGDALSTAWRADIADKPAVRQQGAEGRLALSPPAAGR